MSGDGRSGEAFLPVLSTPLSEITPHGFFAPVSRDTIDDLIKQCARDRQEVERVGSLAESFLKGTFTHFVEGNFPGERLSLGGKLAQLFDVKGGLAHLYASYWQRALMMTDVYDHMPQARRDEWNNSIRDMKTPEFTAETVVPTLRDLLISRERFLAERVDGLFRNLSGKHVTNSPAGFRERMIIAYLVNGYGSTNHDRVGYINDLRCVIARFMGRDQPKWGASSQVVEIARQEMRGQWVTIDGGALRLRAYKCGTAHLEVDEDIAWRLNAILAYQHPNAIPSEFREKPKKKAKSFRLLGRPLPFAVLEILGGMRPSVRFHREGGRRDCETIPRSRQLPFGEIDKAIVQEVERVCEYLGGVKVNVGGSSYFEFDYDPARVIQAVLATGCLPDQKTHQYYPTPEALARRAVEAARIHGHHRILEPSAGCGGIADLLPKDRTVCVEVSALHCKILRAKGHRTAERDFLEWAAEQRAAGAQFDRVVMNPPFSEGRAQHHLDAALDLLSADGRLVAILPGSFRNRPAPAGWVYEWSESIDNEFSGTSISVTILVAYRSGVAG